MACVPCCGYSLQGGAHSVGIAQIVSSMILVMIGTYQTLWIVEVRSWFVSGVILGDKIFITLYFMGIALSLSSGILLIVTALWRDTRKCKIWVCMTGTSIFFSLIALVVACICGYDIWTYLTLIGWMFAQFYFVCVVNAFMKELKSGSEDDPIHLPIEPVAN